MSGEFNRRNFVKKSLMVSTGLALARSFEEPALGGLAVGRLRVDYIWHTLFAAEQSTCLFIADEILHLRVPFQLSIQ